MPRKRRMTIDDLFRMKPIGGAAISPDGRRVVFELTRMDLKKNKNCTQLMIVDVGRAPARPPRPLTGGEHSDRSPKWSPDGQRLAFISNREKPSCLYVMPMDGGEPKRVTDRDGDVRDFAWSPNGRRIAFTYQPLNERDKLERDGKTADVAVRPQFKQITRLYHKLDGAGYWNGHRTHVWVIGSDGGKAKQLTRGDYDDSEPRFSPDGKLVSFISNRSDDPDRNWDQSDIFVVKLKGGPIKRITRAPGECSKHAWSPDGSTIAYLGVPCKSRQWYKFDQHLWAVSSAGGKPRELTRGIDKQCGNSTGGDVASSAYNSSPPIWWADSARVYFQVSEAGATHIYSVNAGGGRRDLRCEIDGQLDVKCMQRTGRDGSLALVIGDALNPADVYVADVGGVNPQPTRLTDVNAGLFKRIELTQPERFTVKSGKATVEGWVLKPPGFRKGRKYPAILEIHGGPESQYGYTFYHELHWLAAKGYVVVYSNPRGSTGYGFEHMRSIFRNWGNLDYKDATKVTDWMARRPYVDTKRIGVTGGSYGGFLTNWLIGKTARYAAAVTQRSCVNWESMLGTSDFGFVIGDEFGGTPWKNHENLRRQSPLTLVKGIRENDTPTLIIHSENDLRCPVEQAEQLFMSMKMLGCDVELVRFEGESHGLSRGGRPQNRRERLRRIGEWFDRKMA